MIKTNAEKITITLNRTLFELRLTRRDAMTHTMTAL